MALSRTLQSYYRKAGYSTAIVGKWHLKSEPTGFDYYHRLIGQGPYYNPTMRTNEVQEGQSAFRDIKHTGYTTEIITDLALEWLKDKRDASKPFYLMYQHKAPHRNWQPGPEASSHVRRCHVGRYRSQQLCSTITRAVASPASHSRP